MAYIVINTCYGGFGLSLEAQKLYLEKKGIVPKFFEGSASWEKHYYKKTPYDFYYSQINRHDKHLAEVVLELGHKANGDCAKLEVVEVEPGTLYKINEYDGRESIEYEWDGYQVAT
jgi:hypothetical protein